MPHAIALWKICLVSRTDFRASGLLCFHSNMLLVVKCLQASDIIQIILDHGKLQSGDILSLLSAYDAKSMLVLLLDDSKTLRVIEKGLYTRTLYKLVSASYLKPSTILSHLSPRDKAIQYEAEEKRKIVGFPTAKELRQAKEVAKAKLKREEEEAEKIGLVSTVV